MNAVITVVGKDAVGILAKVSAACAERGVNILEVTQSVLRDMFCMIMMADVSAISSSLPELSDAMAKIGEEKGLVIHVMHEDIFNSMHRI